MKASKPPYVRTFTNKNLGIIANEQEPVKICDKITNRALQLKMTPTQTGIT